MPEFKWITKSIIPATPGWQVLCLDKESKAPEVAYPVVGWALQVDSIYQDNTRVVACEVEDGAWVPVEAGELCMVLPPDTQIFNAAKGQPGEKPKVVRD